MADVNKWVDAAGRVHYGDWPPSDADAARVKVRKNVIETHQDIPPAALNRRYLKPAVTPVANDPVTPEPRKDISAYIEHCRANRGVDCEWEAYAMIDGPATVLFPGDPAILPRPDLKPRPPGLRLKYGITPLR